MTFIKMCGMTREDDVRAASALGIDAVGFVMWPESPRYVDAARVASLVRALPPGVLPVAVMVAPTPDELRAARDAGVRAVQVHTGGEHAAALPSAEALGSLDLWVATSLERDVASILPGVRLVLDAHDPARHGGTGRTIDWVAAAAVAARRQVVLAGGLTPDNVADAIRTARPFGVDVASGIEQRPGIKNAHAMASFVTAVREAIA